MAFTVYIKWVAGRLTLLAKSRGGKWEKHVRAISERGPDTARSIGPIDNEIPCKHQRGLS